MFRSLYSKLAAVLTGLFCLVGFAIIVVTMFSADMYQQEVNQRLNSKLADHIVAERLLMRENRVNQEAVEDIFHMLMVINPSIEIYLLDTAGTILAFSAAPDRVKRKRIDLGPVKNLLAGHATLPVSGDDPRSLSGKKVFTAARIPEQGQLQGYLYVVQKFQLIAAEKRIALSTKIEEDPPFVNADIGLIERVLENLIENAIQNTPRGGAINLVLTPQNEDVTIQVNDTGCGIPPEELAHIFDRFYQLDKSRKSGQNHSGLGLAITHKILKMHDRSINVASALGSGTTFSFQLPVQ